MENSKSFWRRKQKNSKYPDDTTTLDGDGTYGSVGYPDDVPTTTTLLYPHIRPDILSDISDGTQGDVLQPLLRHRHLSRQMSGESGDYVCGLKSVLGCLLSVCAGIGFASSDLLINTVPFEFTDLALVRSLIHFLLGCVFMLFSCQTPGWPLTATRIHKVYTALYAPLYGVLLICLLAAFPYFPLPDLQMVLSTMAIFTFGWTYLFQGQPIRIWKAAFLTVYFCGVVCLMKPPIIMNMFLPATGNTTTTVTFPSATNEVVRGNGSHYSTLGMALFGVSLLGSFLNASFAYCDTISISHFILYSSLGSGLVALTSGCFDEHQKILSKNIFTIQIIDWIFMSLHSIVSILSMSLLMKGIRLIGANLSVMILQISMLSAQFGIYTYLSYQVANDLTLIGGCLLALTILGAISEKTVRRLLPRSLKHLC